MKTITIDHEKFADLLDRELGEIATFEENADRLIRQMTENPRYDDGLEGLAKGISFNRKMANQHLARAAALLTLVYPELGDAIDEKLDSKSLAATTLRIRNTGF